MNAALLLARDLAALAAALAAVLAAGVMFSGGGVTLGLAATVAAAALGGLAAVAAVSVAAALGASAIIATTALGGAWLVCAFVAALGYGVRGLWIAAAAGFGAAVACLIVWLFARAGVMGAAGPAAAAAAMALIASGALGAGARLSAADAVAAAGELRGWRATLAAASTPPAWFDCLYTALGGRAGAAAPGRCAYAPPQIVSSDASRLSGPTPPALEAPAAPPPLERAGVDGSEAIVVSPPLPALIDAGPVFARTRGDRRLGPVRSAAQPPILVVDGETAALDREPDAPPQEPAPSVEPTAVILAPAADLGLSAQTARALGTASAARAVIVAPTPPLPIADPAPTPAPPPDPRRRTAYVCFPITAADVERLCPERDLSSQTVSATWSTSGGEAEAAVLGVECSIDAGAVAHATLVIASPEEPEGPLSRGDGAEESTTVGAAFYDAATRLIGESRARRAPNQLYASAYFVGADPLTGPWASQSFGAERSDRVFDLASIGQSLALMRRLRRETESRRAPLDADALVAAVAEAVTERPRMEDATAAAARGASSTMVVLVLDARRDLGFTGAHGARLSAIVREAGASLFVVALTADGVPPQALVQAAERAGGAAYGAADLATLSDALDRAMLPARAFCAVRLSGPSAFFDLGPIELSVRRRLSDGCALRQVATLSCGAAAVGSPIDEEALLER